MNQKLNYIKTFISKDYWKSDPKVRSDVSIWRRFLAFIFDSLIGGSLLVSFYLFIEPNIKSRDSSFMPLISLITFYIFFDYWYLPNKTGFTISRWLCGYQILEMDNKFPRMSTLFKRSITLWIINLLTIDFASLFSIIFRKDKRAIHDVLSKTKTKHSIKHLFLLRFGSITFLVIFMFLAGVKAALKSFSSTFIVPQLESLEEWKDKNNVVYLDEIPIEKDGEKYHIKNSNFYICNKSNEITATDSGITFNDLGIKIKTSKSRMNFAKDYNTLTWLPFNDIIIKSFSKWSSEKLHRLTLEKDNIDLLKRLPIIHPIKNIKRVYANLFSTVISRNYKDAIQQGVINNPSCGFYAWVISKDYNVVTFDLLEGDTMNTILYVFPVDRKDFAIYLLNNTGIEN